VSAAVAVGVFDGLHLGHLQILGRARAAAKGRGGRLVVVSFDPHPDVVLAKSFRALAPLTPLPEKRQRLTEFGVDTFELLPFTRELAALEPEAFVDRHLVRPYAPHTLVVGANFALGRARTGNVIRLRQIGTERGFQIEEVPLLEIDGAAVSSTRIRALLGEGRVREAARLLGRFYAVSGVVVPGEAVGRQLGFPTANLRLHEEKLIPADGIYAAWARIDRESVRRPAALSIGVRPTFGGKLRVLEVHLLDWEGELRDHDLEVELVDWIRAQLKFDGPGALVEAMRSDLAQVRHRLALEPRTPAAEPTPGPA
jgi:riboflavin kinase/FMN adenylyltransferase